MTVQPVLVCLDPETIYLLRLPSYDFLITESLTQQAARLVRVQVGFTKKQLGPYSLSCIGIQGSEYVSIRTEP